jgi:hypothetical protein
MNNDTRCPPLTFMRDISGVKWGYMADMVEWAGDYQHYVQLKEELEQKLVAVGR